MDCQSQALSCEACAHCLHLLTGLLELEVVWERLSIDALVEDAELHSGQATHWHLHALDPSQQDADEEIPFFQVPSTPLLLLPSSIM